MNVYNVDIVDNVDKINNVRYNVYNKSRIGLIKERIIMKTCDYKITHKEALDELYEMENLDITTKIKIGNLMTSLSISEFNRGYDRGTEMVKKIFKLDK